ncbi:MAG TPA: NAD(P)-dependent oxidoreductase [Kribbellaceae bacterium]|nr:NAD(P)-dependent oxidoreductase [Kribbellaceae bacterium]
MILLVTGANGGIGRLLRPRLARPGRTLRLLDIASQEPVGPHEDVELVTASVTDPDAMAAACAGVDAVLHLGGYSMEAPWPDILSVNVDGTRTVLEAARHAGVPRVILASSNHAVGYYTRADAGPDGIPADAPARPDTYYGFSKVAMEALGSLYHERYGMGVLCLRIGTCLAKPGSVRGLSTWLSPDDGARLVEACLAVPEPGFRLIWGISRNTRRWWSLAAGEEIGYHPVDDSEVYAAESLVGSEPDLDDPVLNVLGGPFCTVPLGSRMQ